ncbi:hypothetical protein [Tenacibaculum ovolyticum]|uniref:hypothetical protein n=1 Tax=Tenacibaculum ovolyticum TaxID=104270 RepID=UPI0007EC86EA|nr:hypothetical protein [Tenacibaculum ovolyticum]
MKYKKYIIFISIISLIFYCRHQVINHDIPIANIEFVKIEKENGIDGYYNLFFTSDIELTDNLRKEHTGGRIDCFFKNKKIKESDYINYKGYFLSSVGDPKLKSKATKYNYVISTSFERKGYDNISSNLDDEEKLVLKGVSNLLNKDPKCISCIATAVTMYGMPKRYISNTMYIPKENIKTIME